VIAFFLSTLLAVPASQTAPVYVYVSDGILRRAGSFVYKSGGTYTVLYCISYPPKMTLQCVVKTPQDMLVIVDALATEAKT
jgi:hypothetical protein